MHNHFPPPKRIPIRTPPNRQESHTKFQPPCRLYRLKRGVPTRDPLQRERRHQKGKIHENTAGDAA